ncbi:MAG: FAD-dependent monooxygenase [Planctomycetes bacterium]|nr:FAD-dependent monooxygenase [Planctomycetota bacterium]
MLPATTDVLIVGAGPTGMALSIALHQAGVKHLLVDKNETSHTTSRAAVIHAQTLDTLRQLGVSDAMTAKGLKLAKFSIRDRDKPLVALRFDELPTRHPYLLMLPQHETERILAERIARLGGKIHRGVTAGEVIQTEHGTVTMLTQAGREQSVFARYVVGADGMHSTVRESAGISFDGAAFESSFVLADVEMDWPLGNEEVSLFFSPSGLVVVAPLPDGTFRVVATMDDAPEQPALADIQKLLNERGPSAGGIVVKRAVWSSRFRLHHRLARTYRNGRLLLMGDAAHAHSPAGGQGMNTGLVDAVVLGEALARVAKGLAPASALDEYQALRRPAAKKVLGLAGRLTALATMRGLYRRRLRNVLLRGANLLPAARHNLEMSLSGLSRAELAKMPALTSLP